MIHQSVESTEWTIPLKTVLVPGMANGSLSYSTLQSTSEGYVNFMSAVDIGETVW